MTDLEWLGGGGARRQTGSGGQCGRAVTDEAFDAAAEAGADPTQFPQTSATLLAHPQTTFVTCRHSIIYSAY